MAIRSDAFWIQEWAIDIPTDYAERPRPISMDFCFGIH